jgi:hypothetical protein
VPTPGAMKGQIDSIVSYLVEVGLSDDQNLSFIRTSRGGVSEVTFHSAQQVSLSMKSLGYNEIYAHLARERAFIAKMPDGALIQMRYMFVDGILERHSLAFLPSPHLEEFQNNSDIYLEDVVYAEIVAKSIVPFPIRFDFDCREEIVRPILHPHSHLTLGQYENCRIPVSAPLTPWCFLSFVLRNFYHTAFYKYAEEMPYYKDAFEDTIVSEERSLLHFQLPIHRK